MKWVDSWNMSFLFLAWHRSINSLYGPKQSFYTLSNTLIKESEETVSVMRQLKENINARRPNKKYIKANEKIQEATAKLEEGRISDFKFLKYVSILSD